MRTTTTTNGSQSVLFAGAFLHSSNTTPAMKACIESCVTCAAVCEQALRYCLEKGGDHVAAPHIGLLQDCIELCNTAAHFMLRGSQRHAATCRTCADICEACAADCAKWLDDEVMRQCAQTCRECTESCRSMAATAI